MAEDPPLHERIVELAIFVPVGVAVSLIEELPELAEKGRQRLGRQVKVARFLGRASVAEAQRRIAKATGGPPPARPSANHRTAAPAGPAARSEPEERTVEAGERPDPDTLPIPGYDSLAASQVVQRLGALRLDELDVVRRYELATRGRRTILHRIAQLSVADPPAGG